jgi:hypothetical protein
MNLKKKVVMATSMKINMRNSINITIFSKIISTSILKSISAVDIVMNIITTSIVKNKRVRITSTTMENSISMNIMAIATNMVMMKTKMPEIRIWECKPLFFTPFPI